MRTPQTPVSPWSANPRRRKPPPPPPTPPPQLSPKFSRRAFPVADAATTAAAGEGTVVSGYPCVDLREWWLARVEGDEHKIAVAGVFERDQTAHEFCPAPVAKSHDSCTLETEDGIILYLRGSLNSMQTLGYGYSLQDCKKFAVGFPPLWQSFDVCYPKAKSSNTSNSGLDSTLFYAEQFMQGEHGGLATSLISYLKNAENSLHNDADAFQNSSCLSNLKPRFEENTCDGGIATDEMSAAINDDREIFEVVCNEVDNVDTSLVMGSTLKGRGHCDIGTDTSLLFTLESANDANNEEADNSPPTSNQKTPTASLRSQDEMAAATNDDREIFEVVCNEVDNMNTSLAAGSILKGRGHCDIDNDASLLVTEGYANDANNEEADIAPPPSDQQTAAASLKSQCCWDKTQCIALGKLAIEDEEMHTSVYSDVQKSSYAPLSMEVDNVEVGLIEGSTLSESNHSNTVTNVSLAPAMECTNDADTEEAFSTSSRSKCRKRTPVASPKSQGCSKKPRSVALHEKPVGQRKEQSSGDEKLQSTIRSPMIRTRVPYAHQSPLTRGRIESLSMSTPEALKLKKTRCGRVVVPALDPGCQRIVYNRDGSISGIIGLDSPAQPKGRKLKTSARKNRKAY